MTRAPDLSGRESAGHLLVACLVGFKIARVLGRYGRRLAAWLLRRWRWWAPLVAAAIPVLRYGVAWAAGVAGVVVLTGALAALAVRRARPDRYDPAAKADRRLVAHLTETWTAHAHGAGLTSSQPGPGGPTLLVPELTLITPGALAHELVVRPLNGQDLDAYTKAAGPLAISYGMHSVRASMAGPAHIRLRLQHADPLTMPLAPAHLEHLDLAAIPVGWQEDGQPWHLELCGPGGANHIFVAGTTGAGKGSVLWNLVAGAAPGVPAGLVRIWAIDPKGGMELYPGRPIWHRYADETPLEQVELMEEFAAAMQARARAYRDAGIRVHRTSAATPFQWLIVDELAAITALTATKATKELGERAHAAATAILNRGRAAGFGLLAALQDPRVETCRYRDGFPTRVLLRVKTVGQCDMVAGDGMHALGAHADRIPHPGAEGVGYVVSPAAQLPMRVRASWYDDGAIARLAARYPAPDLPQAQAPVRRLEAVTSLENAG
jgi:DNA segregation ATPase FtsK/SpoIIIE, S-DNA-T family